MATETGVLLLSALRKSGSTSALRDVPEEFFVDDEERRAFETLKAHVAAYRSFPTPQMFRQMTGIVTVNTTQTLEYYITQARDRALYNSFLEPFGEMRSAMEGANPSGALDIAREMIRRASALQNSATDFIRFDAALALVMKDYEEAALYSTLRGIPTPWDYLNEITGGWQKDDLISVVGRPGIGKTYILLLLAYAAWMAGFNTLFVSNELGALQLARRMFGIHTRINPDLIRKGRLSSHMYAEMVERSNNMGETAPFNIIAGGLKKSVATVTSVAEATSPDIVFVDASYLLQPEKRRKSNDGRREMVSDTIEDLKRLALDLKRPVIQSVQFNRNAKNVRNREQRGQGEGPPHPTNALTLENIAETDVIGQASSVVMGFCKALPPNETNQRWGKIIKGREGEEGVWLMNYLFSPMNFDVVQVGYGADEPGMGHNGGPPLDVSHML